MPLYCNSFIQLWLCIYFLIKDTESDEVLDGVLSYLCFDIKKNQVGFGM